MFEELRGPKGFEALYQGRPCTTPIVLSTSQTGLDPQANQQYEKLKQAYSRNGRVFPIASDGNGISPFLIAGLSVPIFSSVLILIPGVSLSVGNYKYVIAWRVRSFQAESRQQEPFNGRLVTNGPPDNGQGRLSPPPAGAAWTGTSQDRLPIPAGADSMVYAQTEPTAPDTLADQVAYQVITDLKAPYVPPPVFAGFASGQIAYGEMTQGLLANPGITDSLVSHVPIMTRSLGNELCVLVYREAIGELDTWNFEAGGVDVNIPTYYGAGNPRTGSRSAGILVNTGVAP